MCAPNSIWTIYPQQHLKYFDAGGQHEEIGQLYDLLEEQKDEIAKLTEELDRVMGRGKGIIKFVNYMTSDRLKILTNGFRSMG